MHLGRINECFSHRISGGSTYQWNCFGPNARFLDFESEYACGSVVFDTASQIVYLAEVSTRDDIPKVGPYNWVNPDYAPSYLNECKERELDPNEAWDGVKYIRLETAEDFLEKANAMFNNLDFDTRIEVPLDLDNDQILRLALQAHKLDITINKMIELALEEAIAKYVPVNDK